MDSRWSEADRCSQTSRRTRCFLAAEILSRPKKPLELLRIIPSMISKSEGAFDTCEAISKDILKISFHFHHIEDNKITLGLRCIYAIMISENQCSR